MLLYLDSSAQELSSLNHDKTQLLETLLEKNYGGSEDLLLGELQFAFIAFLMGQSLEAFLQWKSWLIFLFGCTEAVGVGLLGIHRALVLMYLRQLHALLLLQRMLLWLSLVRRGQILLLLIGKDQLWDDSNRQTELPYIVEWMLVKLLGFCIL
ncbi:unnamed protein product [Trifolium pratense]|uniref:Uncharacterized protein n=1 Tax=Trifolium pratense TaxID=57577 RepID=A0ACB0K750_TRIPR|nr:unnamed protein product [Trifolium pratense]